MKYVKTGECTLLNDGDEIEFTPVTVKHGRAGFTFCVRMVRGKIKNLFISTYQQDPLRRFEVDVGYEPLDIFMDYKFVGTQPEAPIMASAGWCREHKAPYFRVITPRSCTKLVIRKYRPNHPFRTLMIGWE